MVKGRWLLLSAIVALSGCDANVKLGNFAEDRARAISRTQEFRQLYDEKNFVGLYELGGPAMKSAVTQEKFISSAQVSYSQFGKRKSSTLMGSSCFPNEVRLVYQSEFEQGTVTEWMVWQVPKEKALLAMYRIEPGKVEFSKESQVGCPS
jgi:hypothetical protein